jgi:predicted transcriptional regulator
VPVKKSVTPDHIVCLEDGKKLKMLKRYLRSRYKLSPDEYRARWNLPPDYPMVAPNYAARRSEFAKKIGLGKGASPKGRKKKV